MHRLTAVLLMIVMAVLTMAPTVQAQSVIIVDDVASYCPVNRLPCHSDGDFILSVGVEVPDLSSVFHGSRSGGQIYNGHAYWAYATRPFVFPANDGEAVWRAYLRQSGNYYVDVFVPYVRTGREDTRYAEYELGSPDGSVSVFYINQNDLTGWIRLGEFYFPASEEADAGSILISPYVKLSTYTEDAGLGRTIKFDAVRWIPVETTEPINVNTYLQDYPDGATFYQGARVKYCYNVSRQAYVRWQWYNPRTGWNLIFQGNDDGYGDTCLTSDPLVEIGIRRIKIEALTGAGGSVLAQDETYFYVESGSVPTTAPRPSATLRPTSTQRPTVTPRTTPVPTRTPTQFSVPTKPWPAIPTSTPRATEKVPVVIVPGYGHALPFTTIQQPLPWVDLLPWQLRDLYEFINTDRSAQICPYNWMETNAQSSTTLHRCITLAGGRADRPVDIITYSNGAQVARSYIQDYPGSYPVDTLYMIAPPNQGVVGAYLTWAGGDLSLEGPITQFITRLAVSLKHEGLCKLEDFLGGQPGPRCIKAVVQAKVPSLHDLLPSNTSSLIDVRFGTFRRSEVYPNTWLEGLNATAPKLFDKVRRIVIHRGVGIETPEKLRIDPSRPGHDGLWPDGEPPWINRLVTSPSGDGRILAARATIPGLTQEGRYQIIDHQGDDHTTVINTAGDDILKDLGIEVFFINPLTIVGDKLPWVFTSSSLSRFMVTDSQGRSTGYTADGTKTNTIPWADVITLTDPPTTMVFVLGVEDEVYRLQIANRTAIREPYTISIISGENTQFAFWEIGSLASYEQRIIAVNPRHTGRVLFLPMLTN